MHQHLVTKVKSPNTNLFKQTNKQSEKNPTQHHRHKTKTSKS